MNKHFVISSSTSWVEGLSNLHYCVCWPVKDLLRSPDFYWKQFSNSKLYWQVLLKLWLEVTSWLISAVLPIPYYYYVYFNTYLDTLKCFSTNHLVLQASIWHILLQKSRHWKSFGWDIQDHRKTDQHHADLPPVT